MVGVFDIHYLTNVQGRAMAVVHKFDLAGSFVGLGVEVSIVPCLRYSSLLTSVIGISHSDLIIDSSSELRRILIKN